VKPGVIGTITADDGTEFWNKLWEIGRTRWHEETVNRWFF